MGRGATGRASEAPRRALAVVTELAREVRRIARGILGSDAYDRYLAHHRTSGSAGAALSEREFWRERYAAQDRRPDGRCC